MPNKITFKTKSKSQRNTTYPGTSSENAISHRFPIRRINTVEGNAALELMPFHGEPFSVNIRDEESMVSGWA